MVRYVRGHSGLFCYERASAPTRSSNPHLFAISTALLRHYSPNTPPKIASGSSSPFPRIRVHNIKRILQARLGKLGHVRLGRTVRVSGVGRSPRLIQIQHQRLRNTILGEVFGRCTTSIIRCAIGHRSGNGGVIRSNELAPYTHKGALQIGALVAGGGAEVAGYVGAVVGADYGVLVAVGGTGGGGVGFCEPIGWADEGGFGVEVLLLVGQLGDRKGTNIKGETHISTLLLSTAVGTFVHGCSPADTGGCEVGSAEVDGGVGGWVIIEDLGDVVFGEEGEGIAHVIDEIVFSADVLRNEIYAFVCVILALLVQAVEAGGAGCYSRLRELERH